MSYLFSFGNYQQNKLSDIGNNFTTDLPEPGFFTGSADVEQALNTVTRATAVEPAIAGGLAAHSVTQGMEQFGKMADPYGIFRDPARAEKTKEFWLRNVDEAVKLREDFKVDPKTHGLAAQLLDSVGSLIPQAALTGPVGTGVLSGIGETAGQVEQGKDLATAGKLGAITGATNAIGVAAPAAFGETLLQKITSGAVANLAIGAASDEAKSQVLSENYPEEAKQYDWANPQSRLIDAVLGAAFGGLAHLQVKPEHVDAALIANESNRIDATNPRPDAIPEHTNNLYSAIDSVIHGEPVTASMPVERVADSSPIQEAPANVYTKKDFIEQARVENPRESARKVAAIAERMAKEANSNNVAASDRAGESPVTNEPPIATIDSKANNPGRVESATIESPEIAAARKFIERHGDIDIPHYDEAGNETSTKLSQLIDESALEMADGEKMNDATLAAVNCFMRFGDEG